MLPKYLKIHGYRSYLDAEIDFEKFGNLFCLIGENGAGKSSIIEMITTALYYRNSCTDNKGTGMDSVINNDCNHFEIQFCFEMNGTEYLIISRKFRDGARELEFYIDGNDQTEKILETQKKINNVIKLDYDVFLDTVCVGQGMSARFMNKKPNERKETLAQILDIKKYENYEKEAKEKRKEIKNAIDDLTSKINFASDKNDDINEIKNSIKEKQKENEELNEQLNDLNKELERITKEKIEYESLISKNQLIINQRRQLKNNIDSINERLKISNDKLKNINVEDIDYDNEIENCQKEIDEKKDEISHIKEQISKLKTENEFFEKDKREIRTKYDDLDKYNKSICDFCGNEITPTHKQNHLSELKEMFKKKNVKIASNNEEIENLNEQGRELSSSGKSISERKKDLQGKKQINENNKRTKEKLINDIKYLKENLTTYQQQYDENISIQIDEIEEKTFNDSQIKDEINDYRRRISNNEQTIAVANSQIEDIARNQVLLKSLNKQLNELKVQFSDYDSVSVAFSKKGIQKSIIKKDLPEIEKEINNILKLLSDNSIFIKFETDKKGNKKDIDTLDVMVHDGNNVRSYETYSGGEKFRIDFSCHIGLAKFLTKRAGATIDFFIVDEGLGSQDSSARQKFIDTLHKISTIFKQVMCITHIRELQDSFNTKVLIEKDPIKGSQISIL